MRVMVPLLLSAFFALAASAQPSSNVDPGKMPLSPNNCGTPYEPKPCGGKAAVTKTSAKPAPSHKAMSHTKTS